MTMSTPSTHTLQDRHWASRDEVWGRIGVALIAIGAVVELARGAASLFW
jgi:hypothetical protein